MTKDNKTISVPKGVNENVTGMSINTLSLNKGYWRASVKSADIEQCLNEEHCVGGDGSDPSSYCAKGYKGPLCAVCQKNYTANGSGESLSCEKCEGSSVATIIVGILGFLLFFGCIIYIVLFCHCKGRLPRPPFWEIIKEKVLEKIQDCAKDDKGGSLIMKQNTLANETKGFKEDSDGIAEKATEGIINKGFMRKYGPIFKVTLAYFQIVSGLAFVLGFKFPPHFSKMTNIIGKWVSFEFIGLMPFGCLVQTNFYDSFQVYTITPIVIAAMLLFFYWSLGRIEKIKNQKKFKFLAKILLFWLEFFCGDKEGTSDSARNARGKNKIFEAFLAMTFIILPNVSVKIFSTFACRPFDGGGYGTFLKADYSLKCYDTMHYRNKCWAWVCVLLYPIGVPIMYFCLLNSKKHLLDPGQMELENYNNEKGALEVALRFRKVNEKNDNEDENIVLPLKSLSFLYSAYEPR